MGIDLRARTSMAIHFGTFSEKDEVNQNFSQVVGYFQIPLDSSQR